MESSEYFVDPENIGKTFEYAMLELAEKALEITGSSSKLEIKALPFDDPMER